jgi:FtsP/CotA-like multicopper oxidase with cupredoxin domain
MRRRIRLLGSCLALLGGIAVAPGGAAASVLTPQTWLPGECVPQFKTALPVFGPGYNAALPRVNAVANPKLLVKMVQSSRGVLPDPQAAPYNATDNAGKACPQPTYGPTTIWAYETWTADGSKKLAPAFWPAVTLENRRGKPTTITYENDLPSWDVDPTSLQGRITVDKTIHWADPQKMMMLCMNNPTGVDPVTGIRCGTPYTGPVPAVPHLHGGEVPSAFDGGPEAWFTPTGLRGTGYRTLDKPAPNQAIYRYPNAQEPGTLWFHDHALGATRTNVYSGMAAFYFLRDPLTEPRNLPKGAYEIEMAVQDRQFDTDSQLFFPDGSGPLDCIDAFLNPVPCSNLNGPPTNPGTHTFWIPEFAGDVAVVNGSPWPVLKVEPRRYRFRIVNGSNARVWNLKFGAAPVYAIGADDTYLDAPAPITSVFIAPGERADIIVDFTGIAGAITVTNDAPVPFPAGLSPVPYTDPVLCPDPLNPCPADQPQMASVMQFDVSVPLVGTDSSCNPAAGRCGRVVPTVRLTTGAGAIAPGVKVDKVRRMVLKEHQGAGGPLEVLVNNTHWNGLTSPRTAMDFPANGISELPRQGSTELWEIVNLTMDAHPIHTHLVQYQILNRESFAMTAPGDYPAAWAAAFGNPLPASPVCDNLDPMNPCPGYGPPLPYNNNGETTSLPNGQTGVPVVGGNPSLAGYLMGDATPPAPEESGWKDTAKADPGKVTRFLVRWTPTSIPVVPNLSFAGENFFPFNPTKGPGYVWHCHIIDHEDNEMMRPYLVAK